MSFPQKIIQQLIAVPPKSREDILDVIRKMARKEGGGATFPTTSELLAAYNDFVVAHHIAPSKHLKALLQKRPVRTLSGVAIITVLARPYPCPGKCTYCPTEVRMPKSYLEKEPAAWRALILKFDPYTQVRSRIETLMANGHPTDKIELIVKGGTWSAYPEAYQRWFLKRCFDGANEAYTQINAEPRSQSFALARGARLASAYRGQTRKDEPEQYTMLLAKSKEPVVPADESGTRLEKEHQQIENRDQWIDATPVTDKEIEKAHRTNERSAHRIIGITLETRPDWITTKEVARLRALGCTRIELGVQHTDPKILRSVNRGHDIGGVKYAALLLREAGFKVDFHMMPQLPGATPKKDIAAFDTLWKNPDLRPDMIKIYPCVVLKTAELFRDWKEGRYKPYSLDKLIKVLIAVKSRIPRYVRIARLIRDIPKDYIYAGNRVTNLRQTIQALMAKRGLTCACLRCREVGHQPKNFQFLRQRRIRLRRTISNFQTNSKSKIQNPKLFVDEYNASSGKEYLISFEDPKRTTVYAFCRLRIPARIVQKKTMTPELDALLPEIKDCAFIRELHTYGHLVQFHSAAKPPLAPPLQGGEGGGSRGGKGELQIQHTGLGRQLMEKAEDIVRSYGARPVRGRPPRGGRSRASSVAASNGVQKIAVIAGVGVRAYYRKLGYRRAGTYMVKPLALKSR